ncbi:hypothetical protein D3C75_959480 [compost metagenome]
MGAERHTLLRNLAHLAQAEYLKAAAVREDRAVPVHELVQPACLADDLMAGAEKQVIRIAQNNMGIHGLQFLGAHGLYSGKGAYRHKGRGFNHAVGRMHSAQTGAGLLAGFDMFVSDSQSPLPFISE